MLSANRTACLLAVLALLGSTVALAQPAPTSAAPSAIDASEIRSASGSEPLIYADGAVRIAWPRNDVAVTVDGVRVRPAAGLTSWAAFMRSGRAARLVGESVLFEDELMGSIDAALARNLDVVGLYTRFAFDQPRVYVLRVAAEGEARELASGIKAVWDSARLVRSARPEPAARFTGDRPPEGRIDPDPIGRTVGVAPTVQEDVVRIAFARQGSVSGTRLGEGAGLTTWAAFQGDDTFAVVGGDFILTADEVQPVLRSLRRNRILITSLHNHLIGEHPPFYVLHFWGKGRAQDLAQAIRWALDAQLTTAGARAPVPVPPPLPVPLPLPAPVLPTPQAPGLAPGMPGQPSLPPPTPAPIPGATPGPTYPPSY